MDAQGICRDLLAEVEGGLGCIVIDMQTGLTVAAAMRSGTVLDSEGINLVSIVATNMFSGKLIGDFERALGRVPSSRFVREAHMTTDNVNHFMAVIPGWEDGLLVLVTDSAVSLGLGWMAIHRFVDRFTDAPRPTEAIVPQHSYEWQDELPPVDPSPPSVATLQTQHASAAAAPEEPVLQSSPPAAAAQNEAAPRTPRGARMNMFASRRDKERK